MGPNHLMRLVLVDQVSSDDIHDQGRTGSYPLKLSHGFRGHRNTCFRKYMHNDIIRVAFYDRKDFELDIIRINPHDNERIRTSILQPACAPATSLGCLDVLPLEMLHEICQLLDIKSLFRFRQVNLRAQDVVCAIRIYRIIITYALETLCASLRTHIASWFILRDLFDVLCARDCPLCGSFGGFIFFPTFTRCCFPCIKTAPQLRLVSLA